MFYHVQLDQLMGHFSQQTGSQFNGSGSQYQMIANLASEKLGIPVPPQLLEKLCAAPSLCRPWTPSVAVLNLQLCTGRPALLV
jgi:hypothetical protein